MIGVYTPDDADEWKGIVRAGVKLALMKEGLSGILPQSAALGVDLTFRFQRPKSHWRTGRHSGKLKPSAPFFHTTKPDKDNLEKAFLDAVTKFGGLPPLIWPDDSQVCDGRTQKRYCEPGEDPGVEVAIYSLSER